MKIRGSFADTALECSGSLVETDTPYQQSPDDTGANEGRAKHEALSHVPLGTEPPIDTIAERYGVDVDDLRITYLSGRKAWRKIAQWFPVVECERKVEGPYTKGTADVVCVTPDAIAINDWKTGMSGDEHQRQLMAYADALRHEFGMPPGGVIIAFETFVCLGDYVVHHFTEAQLDGFRERCKEQIEAVEKGHPRYTPGPHCKFCPRQTQCQAIDDYHRSTIMALVPQGDVVQAITREKLGELYDRVSLLKKAIARYDKIIDEELTSGPINLPDGRKLALKEESREKITDTLAVMNLLSQAMIAPHETVVKQLTMTKTAIKRIAKEFQDEDGAAATERRILELLREHGIIVQEKITKKEIVR